MKTQAISETRRQPKGRLFFPHVIDGKDVPSADDDRFDNVDPWTREAFAQVAAGSDLEVAAAIHSARRAFDEGPWPRMGMEERSRVINKFADTIEAHADDLARADVHDMGMPMSQMRDRLLPRTVAMMRIFADHARMSLAHRMPSDTGHHIYTRFDPAGVVAAIVPWNAPLLTTVWKIAPALAWGNTVVCKPSTISPASATILARMAIEAGLPPGVLNVIHGPGATVGERVANSRLINRITFTGSTSTGRAIGRVAGGNLIPVSLELGGKSAHLIFEDAHLDRILPVAINGVFMNAGQMCFSGSRLYVQHSIYETFIDRFVDAANALEVGDPMKETTQIGPLASSEQFERVCGYLATIDDDGGVILTGGPDEGWIVRPTVVTGLDPEARACREEIFGPVATISPFKTEEEAIGLANDSPYGLAALISTESVRRAHRLASVLRGGIVWVNCFPSRDLRGPYGGTGDSGFGREGGHFSRDFFTEPKQVIIET